MAWPSRLVEVWAADAQGDGKCGSGWVVGSTGILTAGHVVTPFLDASAVAPCQRTCQVRLGGSTSLQDWMDCEISWVHPSLDVVLLRVSDDRWRPPDDPAVQLGRLGERVLSGEAVGFPDMDTRPDGNRGPEQPSGRLQPAAGARDDQGRLPFDVDTSVPDDAALWKGMSGGVVRDEYGRLVAVVSEVHPAHQQRRLLVIPIEDGADEPGFAQAADRLGLNPVVQDREAPRWRRGVSDRALSAQGLPHVVAEVTDLAVFGVKPAVAANADLGLFPTYLSRDIDDDVRTALDEAASGGRRVVLVIGDSASGKSRSAAQAVRVHTVLNRYRLIVPSTDGGLSRLLDDGLDLNRAVIWLDDVDMHFAARSAEHLETILQRFANAVVVATIRASQLRELQGELRDPLWSLLNNEKLVMKVRLDAGLSDNELVDARQIFAHKLLLISLDEGVGLGEWLIAGPELLNRLDHGDTFQNAFAHTVICWYRTGINRPLPEEDARRLWGEQLELQVRDRLATKPSSYQDKQFDKAMGWALHPIIERDLYEQSLLRQHRDGLVAHDYVVDQVTRRHEKPPVPDPTWSLAAELAHRDLTTKGSESLSRLGLAAHSEGAQFYAVTAMATLAENGYVEAMYNLGVILSDEDRDAAIDSYRLAADNGHVAALFNLGVLFEDLDREESKRWYRRAADKRHAMAMNNLGVLLETEDPEAAKDWYRRAADEGHVRAMNNLALLLRAADRNAAEALFTLAAKNGEVEAMTNLGVLLETEDPEAAKAWYRRAADEGHVRAMTFLGSLLESEDREAAKEWYRRAADQGHTGAMNNLGILRKDEDREDGKRWFKLAAENSDSTGMFNMGRLLEDEDREAAKSWYRRAADEGETGAMLNLGHLLEVEDREAAKSWYRQAATKGHSGAMNSLGVLLHNDDPKEAKVWYRRAAERGDTTAMFNLGALLHNEDRERAKGWFKQAAEGGDVDAKRVLSELEKEG